MILPALGRESTTVGHLQERFELRAQALFYARLAQMAVLLLVLAVPAWRRALHIPVPYAVYGYLALLAMHALSYLWVGRRAARAVLFASLCFDLLGLVWVAIASGGLKSPVMATQVVFTMIFALLFPSPLAIVPPLLMLPIVAWSDQILGLQRLPVDVLLLLWYAALNITVVYVVVYLEGRERIALSEVLRLQRERRQRELVHQRKGIAREIHDGVGAALSGIVLQAEYLEGRTDPGEVRQELSQLREAAVEGMEELRRAVSLLRREFELTSSVAAYAATFASRHHLPVATEVRGVEPELEAETELALFRIVQEALANVARHARARSASVLLEFSAGAAKLVVRDDGCGFSGAEAPKVGHYGLRSMHERARRIGGELSVESTLGVGTVVTLKLALRGDGARR
ncbi:MAG: sensor histidine kinase [Proteobacteria bacterium]|nr:sensor histidine kinase [Pseudomonadota bacterium]